jgi:hypothetical protein
MKQPDMLNYLIYTITGLLKIPGLEKYPVGRNTRFLVISGKMLRLSGNPTYRVIGLVLGANSSFPGRSAGVGLNGARFAAVSGVQALPAESLPFADRGGEG